MMKNFYDVDEEELRKEYVWEKRYKNRIIRKPTENLWKLIASLERM